MEPRKTLRLAMRGSTDIRFRDVWRLAEAFGFRLARVSGSHHIFTHPDMPQLLNLQEDNGRAKDYQVRQLLGLVDRYRLTLGDDR